MLKENYRIFYLNDSKSRWIYVDRLGRKDKIVLKTKSGRLETRTCQYYMKFYKVDSKEFTVKCKITYKGNTLFVTEDTILD